MHRDWFEVRLGDVLAPSNERLGPHDQEPVILSLSKYDGFVRAEDYFDKRIASSKLDTYKVVPPDGWAYSTIHIDEGSIARNTLGVSGVISPMYTTMRWIGQAHEPAYFELLLRSPGLLSSYSDNARGSINRRRSLLFGAFSAITVLAPPLEVQRRIVDLVASVDDHIARLRREALYMSELAEARRTHLPPGGEVPLGTVLEGIDSGRSLGLNDSAEHPSMRVLMLSAVRPAVFNPREVKPLPADASMPDDALVREGDLLITRSNTPDRVGYACRARGVQPGTYMPDLIWRLRMTQSCDADYLEQALASPQMRGRVTGSAGGTSQSMRKINKAGLRTLLIPLPSLDDQLAYAADCAALAGQSQALAREADGLAIFRRQLLSGLLSREVEIPDAYDRIVEAGVSA